MLSRFRILLLLLIITGWHIEAAPRLIRTVSMTNAPVYKVANPTKGVDTLYVFKSLEDAYTETLRNNFADWKEIPTQKRWQRMNVLQTLEDGHCYQVVVGNDTITFAVIDFSKHTIDSFAVDLDCKETTITYRKDLAMQYYRPDGSQTILPYDVAVKYQNQQWDSVAIDWKVIDKVDSIYINKEGKNTIGANLCDTKFEFVESRISSVLLGDSSFFKRDSLYEAVAVDQRLQYYITKRGSTQENEKEGPYGTENLKSTVVHSAPIDVLFEAHPSSKADVYNWTIKKSQTVMTARNDKDIRYTFDEVSETAAEYYYVDLVVRNSEHTACTDTGKVDFELHSSLLLVPNVFTPNGDGVNDEFRVAYRSICEFHCWVYNRWQHLVYQWDDPAKGWDGTFLGKKEPDSAYFYVIEAKGCDGIKYKLKGTVNLLRGK